jgi:hypothetical protein
MASRIAILCLILLVGCNAPQWRVFQSKVPAPLVKSAVQIEAERASADLVARTITAPLEIVPVAQKLSESLGVPEHPITQASHAKAAKQATTSLTMGIVEAQQIRDDLNDKLAKFDGKKIEGTGVNLFGFAVSLPVLGLIALAIFCPGVLIWILANSRGALFATIKGIQSFKASNPYASISLDSALDSAQDAAHKALVKKLKAKL